MLKINPSVTMPYWDFSSDFSAPEKSIIWEFFGHAGNPNQDYCVIDGPFANQQLNYPKRHCLKREWNKNGTIPALVPPEWMTSVLQIGHLPSFYKQGAGALLYYDKDYAKAIKNILSYFPSYWYQTDQTWMQVSQLTSNVHFKTHLAIGKATKNIHK
jgi:hypothetical protein